MTLHLPLAGAMLLAVFGFGCFSVTLIGSVPEAASACPATQTGVTVAEYQSSAPKWGDYYRTSTPSTPCDGTETGLTSCIHGGERRAVTLTDLTSCAGVTATDSADAFEWTCKSNPSSITVYSTGLRMDRRLADLIDGSSPGLPVWKSLSLKVNRGSCVVARTAPAVWWSNTVSALPDNSATAVTTLAAASQVYYAGTSMNTRGYNINADKISIAMPDSVTVRANTVFPLNSGAAFEAGASDATLLAAGNQKFLWAEGNWAGEDSTSTARPYFGLALSAVKYSMFRYLRVSSSVGYNYFAELSDYNRFMFCSSSGSRGGAGVSVQIGNGSDGNLLYDFATINNSVMGYWFSFGNNLTAVGILSASNSGSGMKHADGAMSASYLNVSVLNNGGNGFETTQVPHGMSLVNLLTANNTNGGMALGFMSANTSGFKAWNVASLDNGGIPILIDRFNNYSFGGALLVDSTVNPCSIGGGVGEGLTHNSCAPIGTSTASLYTGRSIAGELVGPVAVEDQSNTGDLLGLASFATLTDFFRFDSFWRSWGQNHPTYPAAPSRGACTSGTCQIWDYSVPVTADVIRESNGTGTAPSEPFVVGAPCPSSASGNKAFTDAQARTFLISAVEALGTGGNDNGVCESGESCIYTPNFGAYQGSGDWHGRSCIFENGTVTGVTLYGRPTYSVSP